MASPAFWLIALWVLASTSPTPQLEVRPVGGQIGQDQFGRTAAVVQGNAFKLVVIPADKKPLQPGGRTELLLQVTNTGDTELSFEPEQVLASSNDGALTVLTALQLRGEIRSQAQRQRAAERRAYQRTFPNTSPTTFSGNLSSIPSANVARTSYGATSGSNAMSANDSLHIRKEREEIQARQQTIDAWEQQSLELVDSMALHPATIAPGAHWRGHAFVQLPGEAQWPLAISLAVGAGGEQLQLELVARVLAPASSP